VRSVDAPLTAPDALIRPWRTATIVATLVAAIELVLLVVLGFAVLAKPVAHALRHHATAKALAPAKHHVVAPARHVQRQLAAVAHLARSGTGILVLNGNGRTGAAATEAARLQGLGYPVTATGNAPRHDYATTVVMYRPGYRGEAMRLARDLGLKAVGPLDGMAAAALHGGKLALILGAA
jgi:hypothetical protein